MANRCQALDQMLAVRGKKSEPKGKQRSIVESGTFHLEYAKKPGFSSAFIESRTQEL